MPGILRVSFQAAAVRGRCLPAARLLNEIYEQTGYAAMVQAMPGGSQRKANLLLLTEYAKKYESVGYGACPVFFGSSTGSSSERTTWLPQPRCPARQTWCEL